MTQVVGSRQERKQRTRQALLDGSLHLLADRGLATLSLREVAREVGIVPTAFYRHFESMDALGIALVEECTRTLRALIREARAEGSSQAIPSSVRTLARYVTEHTAPLSFLTRERHGGVPAVRRAIAAELRLFASELATDLARFPWLSVLDSEDLRMAADLMVNAMSETVLGLLEIQHPDDERDLLRTAERQLRLIIVGMTHWRP
ncbi:MAG: TetR family transcriptional regulator [Sciscionella sp.]